METPTEEEAHAQALPDDGSRTPASARRVGRGSVREVAALAYPVILSQLSITAMGFIDSAMAGRLGATELAAVGFAGIWCWTWFTFFFGTATGVQTFVSQADGAGRQGECGGWAWQAGYVVVPLTALAALGLWLWLDPFLSLLGPSAELQATAASYLRPRLVGGVGLAFAMVLTSFFRGLGDTHTPMYATLVSVVVNAILDYGLIFGKLGFPEWGVYGAGFATAVAEWLDALLLFIAFSRRKVSQRYATGPTAPHPDSILRFVRIGVPVGGQWVLEMLSFAVFTTFIARMGDTSMAASQALIILLSLSFMQSIGLSIAASTLVGRYIGARDNPAAWRSFWSAEKMVVVLAGSVALLFVAAPGLLMRIFSDDPEVIGLGRSLVSLAAAFQLFDAFGIVASGALRGAGDTRWPFVVQTAFAWLFFVPATYLLGVHLGGGLFGAWVAGTLYVLLVSVTFVARFRSGAWQQFRI